MYSPFYVSKRLVLLPILAVVAIQLVLIRSVSSLNMTNAYLHHKCYVNQGKYKPGSAYEGNLKTIIHTISSTGNFRYGYEMISLNDGTPNFISVNLQCRGDSYGPKCRSCYSTALSTLRKRCSTYKGGIIWYDQCLLEITTINSEGKIDYENNICMTNAKNVSSDQADSFGMEWMTLLENLTGIVISKNNVDDKKAAALYAAGERRIRTKKLYGMLQCTKDLTFKSCRVCVGYIARNFYKCCEKKQGARVLGRSCNFRFEFYPFVNRSNSDSRYLET